MALGNVIEASLSSSDMCAPASGPMKHQMGDANPIKHDRPVLDQPPPLLAKVSPSHAIRVTSGHLLKCGEHILRWSMLGHDPKRHQECEKSKNVEEQDDAFCQRQMLREEDVEPDCQQDE